MKKPKLNKNERRFTSGNIEIRAADDDEGMPTIFGYAALFNVESDDMGFIETVAPGAFDKTIGDDIRALFNHNPDIVLGRTIAKTLQLRVDNKGLYFENHLPDTPQARSLMTSIERGDVSQMSFGFIAVDSNWNFDNEPATRELLEVKLTDVSPVTYAAYPDTAVALRSMELSKIEQLPEIKDYSSKGKRLDLLGLET